MIETFKYIVYEKREVDGKETCSSPAAGFQRKEDAKQYAVEKTAEVSQFKSPIKRSFYVRGDDAEKVKQIMDELTEQERRTKVEEEAIRLVAQGDTDKAIELLKTI